MNPVAPLPDPNNNYVQQNSPSGQDAEHLNLLSIFYYVMAGLTALGGLAFVFQIFMGLMIATSTVAPGATITVSPNTFPGAPVTPPPPPLGPPTSFGWIFVAIGVAGLLIVEAVAAMTFLAGRNLAKRKKKTLIQVVAALLCLNIPLGTALGVFTFIVLGRPSVAALFEEPHSA